MVWRYGGYVASHKIWSGSMQRFLRNLSLRTDGRRTTDDGRTDGRTDDGRLRHDSSSADKVKQS